MSNSPIDEDKVLDAYWDVFRALVFMVILWPPSLILGAVFAPYAFLSYWAGITYREVCSDGLWLAAIAVTALVAAFFSEKTLTLLLIFPAAYSLAAQVEVAYCGLKGLVYIVTHD